MPGPRFPPGHSRQPLTGQGGYHVYTDNANVDRKGNDISTVKESLQDRTVDGFRLAYDRRGRGPGAPVVLLLHGWPRDRTDYREVVPLVSATADVVVPDPRGFGESAKHPAGPASTSPPPRPAASSR
jgi:hypothetical protein